MKKLKLEDRKTKFWDKMLKYWDNEKKKKLRQIWNFENWILSQNSGIPSLNFGIIKQDSEIQSPHLR